MAKSIDRYAFGVVAKALARAGVSVRRDRRDGLVALLARLLRQAQGDPWALFCPEVEVSSWRAQGMDRPPSARTVQRWGQLLEELGLIRIERQGQQHVAVFLFEVPGLDSYLPDLQEVGQEVLL